MVLNVPIYFDYAATTPVDPRVAQKNKDQGEDVNTVGLVYASVDERKMLVGRDDRSKQIFSHLVRCKGTADERIVEKIVSSMVMNARAIFVGSTIGSTRAPFGPISMMATGLATEAPPPPPPPP